MDDEFTWDLFSPSVDVVSSDPFLDVPPSASAYADLAGTGADQQALGEGIVQQSLGSQIVADTQAGFAQEALGRGIVAQASQDWWSSGAGVLRAVGNALPVASAAARSVNGSSATRSGSVARPQATLWDTYVAQQGITGPQLVMGGLVFALGAYAIHRYA